MKWSWNSSIRKFCNRSSVYSSHNILWIEVNTVSETEDWIISSSPHCETQYWHYYSVQSFSCLPSMTQSASVLCAANLSALLSCCLSDSSCNPPFPPHHCLTLNLHLHNYQHPHRLPKPHPNPYHCSHCHRYDGSLESYYQKGY